MNYVSLTKLKTMSVCEHTGLIKWTGYALM